MIYNKSINTVNNEYHIIIIILLCRTYQHLRVINKLAIVEFKQCTFVFSISSLALQYQ